MADFIIGIGLFVLMIALATHQFSKEKTVNRLTIWGIVIVILGIITKLLS